MSLTKYNYNSFDVTPVASKALAFNSDADGFTTVAEGSMALIKTLTASSSATLDFVDGSSDVVLDSTYPIYLFKFINIHPANATYFSVNFSDDGGSNYDLAKTSSAFGWWTDEAGTADTSSLPLYRGDWDLAEGTGIQPLGGDTMSNANDNGGVGYLYLFNPSSTTFVKHFTARYKPNYSSGSDPYTQDFFTAGYINDTAAVTAVQFKMNSGNIDAGTIKLYGLKDS